jgi:hypothetical protein
MHRLWRRLWRRLHVVINAYIDVGRYMHRRPEF